MAYCESQMRLLILLPKLENLPAPLKAMLVNNSRLLSLYEHGEERNILLLQSGRSQEREEGCGLSLLSLFSNQSQGLCHQEKGRVRPRV